MFNQATIANLHTLKLSGFAAALHDQLAQPAVLAMSFEERLALLVDRELAERTDRKRERLLQRAHLKFPGAAIENVDLTDVRGIDRKIFTSLALSGWVERGDAILFGGATGVGKTWLACALAQHACRRGYSALSIRMPRLAEELRTLHASGGFSRWLAALARTDVLILDDWGTGALDPGLRTDLLEIIDDRASQRATIITHQLTVDHWHGWIGDATIADAILDRLMQRVHRFDLKGPSRRSREQKNRGADPKEPLAQGAADAINETR